jgi:integrase
MAIGKTKAGTFRLDYRDQHKKRIRETFDTFREARAREKIVNGDIEKGDFVAPSNVTVKDAAEAWHKRKADTRGYRPGTLQNWQTHIDKYIVPSLGDRRIQQVTIDEIEDASADWTKMTSANTANDVLTTLSAIFKREQRNSLKGKPNNAALAERVKVSNDEEPDEEVKPEDVYNQEELKKLINATAPGTLERLLVMVPALTGLRIGEVLGLTWPHVDLKASQLNVRLNLIDVGKTNGGRQLRTPKSKSSKRTLDLPQELAHELKVWKLACPPSDDNLVFATLEGKPLHRKAASQILDAAITAAGLEKRLTPHKLRHGFASLLLDRGVAVPKVSRLLGHRDSVITMKVYAHWIKDKKNDVQELASSIFYGSVQ